MSKLVVSQDWTGSAPLSAAWNCVDDDYDLGRPVGHGHTANEAVCDYLEQCDNQEIDELLWELRAGINTEWHVQIRREAEARTPMDAFKSASYDRG